MPLVPFLSAKALVHWLFLRVSARSAAGGQRTDSPACLAGVLPEAAWLAAPMFAGRLLAAEGRTARRAPESRFAFLACKTNLTTDLLATEATKTMARRSSLHRTELTSLGPNV